MGMLRRHFSRFPPPALPASLSERSRDRSGILMAIEGGCGGSGRGGGCGSAGSGSLDCACCSGPGWEWPLRAGCRGLRLHGCRGAVCCAVGIGRGDFGSGHCCRGCGERGEGDVCTGGPTAALWREFPVDGPLPDLGDPHEEDVERALVVLEDGVPSGERKELPALEFEVFACAGVHLVGVAQPVEVNVARGQGNCERQAPRQPHDHVRDFGHILQGQHGGEDDVEGGPQALQMVQPPAGAPGLDLVVLGHLDVVLVELQSFRLPQPCPGPR